MSDNKFKKRLWKIPIWQWLLACIITSELLTFFISYSGSYIFWGEISNEVLLIGIIDSLLVSFIIVGVLLLSIRKIRELYDELEKQNRELTLAFSDIKKLQGILSICSYCKKIRNDKGHYEQIEEYIYKHSDADFSHIICPTCLKENYPKEYAQIFSEGK